MDSITVWSGRRLELGKIPLELRSSTIPVLRGYADVHVAVTSESIHVEAVEDSNGEVWPLLSGGPGAAEIFEFDLATRGSIQSVDVAAGYSSITIFHDDPYQVEEAFRTVFVSKQSYWIKAFAKMLHERLGVEIQVEPDDDAGF